MSGKYICQKAGKLSDMGTCHMLIKYGYKKVYWIKDNGVKELIAGRLAVADKFWPRLCGLMGKRIPINGCALLLFPCRAVHTWFMKFPIDVVYLDHDMNVVKTVKNMRPWRFDFGDRRAKHTLEFPAGTINFDKGKVIIEKWDD